MAYVSVESDEVHGLIVQEEALLTLLNMLREWKKARKALSSNVRVPISDPAFPGLT